jgi:hypothetical protein
MGVLRSGLRLGLGVRLEVGFTRTNAPTGVEKAASWSVALILILILRPSTVAR